VPSVLPGLVVDKLLRDQARIVGIGAVGTEQRAHEVIQIFAADWSHERHERVLLVAEIGLSNLFVVQQIASHSVFHDDACLQHVAAMGDR
jgi:hypothetical protein